MVTFDTQKNNKNKLSEQIDSIKVVYVPLSCYDKVESFSGQFLLVMQEVLFENSEPILTGKSATC